VRLIRAIEIAKKLGEVPEYETQNREHGTYDFLQIGINWPKEVLHKRIKLRLKKRLKQGMIKEVKDLHFKDKISWKRLESFGLEYYWIARYLQNKITIGEMKERLYFDIIHYAKRQMTWFRKNKKIHWHSNIKSIEARLTNFQKG
jgi:tRNA dimethylallyltransferase